MKTLSALLFAALLFLVPAAAQAQPVETERAGVTAEVVELRQTGGVLRLAVRFANGGAKNEDFDRYGVDRIVLVDVKSKKKHFPLKDANGQYIGGPIGDWIDGGRIALGIKIDLAADVLFDFDKASIKKEAEASLQNLATVLKANPTAAVAIEGHTDAKAADAYNQTLSEQRAASVKQWLVANAQVSGANISTRGWGKSKPDGPALLDEWRLRGAGDIVTGTVLSTCAR